MDENKLPVIEKKLNTDVEKPIKIEYKPGEENRKIELDEQRRKDFTLNLQLKEEFLRFDFSKTHIKNEEYKEIVEELNQKRLKCKTQEMFLGGHINFTENKPVLHTLLRNKDVIKEVEELEDRSLSNESKKIKSEGPCCKSECCPKINSQENNKCDETCEKSCNKKESCDEVCDKKESCDEECFLEETKKEIIHEFKKIRKFCKEIHTGKIKSVSNKKFKFIVNIGIGGSDLGPRIVCQSLERYKISHMKCYFVSNVDPMDLYHTLSRIKADETLFVVVSKTFTTQETMANANLALELVSKILKKPKEKISDKQFIAISSNLEEVKKFGIKNCFAMWDFVGGRFSLWSAAGISIALYLGFDNFLKLLKGASQADNVFKINPLENNSTMHAIIEHFYIKNNYPTKCIVPYDYYLRNFYLHLQQVDMESNGKKATKDGFCDATSMIIWGGVGTNSQHSFFQLIHQGTHKILTEFLYPLNPEKDFVTNGSNHHTKLIANCLAQSEALMTGKDDQDNNKKFFGNKPSISICYSKLTPETIGALIAHYENKVFVQGILWGINSFDQFGVGLGKVLADGIISAVEKNEEVNYSASTMFAINELKKNK